MITRRKLVIVAALCSVVLATLTAILVVIGRRNERPIIYITGFALESLIVSLDPTATDCSKSKLKEFPISDLQEVKWTSNNEILYLQRAVDTTEARFWLLKTDNGQAIPYGPPLQIDPEKGEYAQVSHSLRYIAVYHKPDRNDYGDSRLDIIDIQTGVAHQIMTGTLRMDWSPVQDQLAGRGIEFGIYIVSAKGEIIKDYHPQPLPLETFWSPDGKAMAFVSNLADDNKVEGPVKIYTIMLQTGQQTQIGADREHSGTRSAGFYSWSPNKKYIAFISDPTASDSANAYNVLYVLDTSSGQEIKIAENVKWARAVWNESGHRIAFIASTTATDFGEIFVHDIDSGKQTQLTCDRVNKESLSW